MASKQGGKGKTSSPSRKASHANAKRASELRRDQRIARHCRRMGLNAQGKARATALVSYPKLPLPRIMQKVVLTESVRDLHATDFPVYQAFIGGVQVEASGRFSDCATALRDSFGQHERWIMLQHPSGRKELLQHIPGRGEYLGDQVSAKIQAPV